MAVIGHGPQSQPEHEPPIGTLRPMTVRLIADIQNRMFCAGSGCGYPRDEGDQIRPLC
jgi:hypothetical protein